MSDGGRLSRLGLPLVLLLALGLFAWGIDWGLPSWRGWAGDELLPQSVSQGLAKRFSGGWHTKYPPFHYYLLALVQTPIRRLLQGTDRFEVHEHLMLAGRWLSVTLALGTVWLIYRTGREIYGRRGAVFAGLAAALMPTLVYFAKTANVDGPFLFWIAASLLFYVRLLDRHRLRDYVLFTACAFVAVATKDQAYGLYVLSPLVILPSLRRHLGAGWVKTLLDRRVLAAVATAVVVFVLSFNIPWNSRGFSRHVGLLTGSQSEEAQAYPNSPSGHLQNMAQALRDLEFCVGAPVFAAALLGIGWTFFQALFQENRRERSRLGALLVLGLSYCLTFLSVVLFSRDRYVLPLGLILALFAGHLFGALTAPGAWRSLRIGAATAALAYSFLLALSVDLRMVNDSRYDAERWLRDRAPLPRQAVAVGRAKHSPRISVVEWRQVWRTEGRVLQRPGTRFVVVNLSDLRSPEERRLYERLRAGEFGHRLAESSRWRSPWDRLDTRGRFTTLDLVNPRLEVYER
ncbi:MAG TPA: glycosyltransferase family 39 protein [Thermoanaerobaculia bacterium]